MPAGGRVIGIAGTAPGLVLETDGAVVVILRGRPQASAAVAGRRRGRRGCGRSSRCPDGRASCLRTYGVSESAVAQALAGAGGEPEGVQATICAHDGEIWVELFGPGKALASTLAEALGPAVFAEDDRPVEELILDLAREQGLTLGLAESCTGGLVAARLTSVPGASDVLRGGIVAYENEVKLAQLGVPEETLVAHGAVSAETATAMAEGARTSLDADVAVAVTGIAGPGGGTPEKPVGLVHIHAAGPGRAFARELHLPGDREAIRRRATAAALHLLRKLLAQSRHTSA